ncbi:MAG TPA: excinuclease [Rhodanobacter sp.]|nr:excinuclease [Rhodanobacter sp.]
MKAKVLALALLAMASVPGVSSAEDVVYLSFQDTVAAATASGKLDGSVKFYLAGNQPAGKVDVVNDNVVTNKKTNAFGKSSQESCSWALQSALITLQDAAKQAGANAVVDIESYYKKQVHSDPKNYECHKGSLMSGVALKGKLAKVH